MTTISQNSQETEPFILLERSSSINDDSKQDINSNDETQGGESDHDDIDLQDVIDLRKFTEKRRSAAQPWMVEFQIWHIYIFDIASIRDTVQFLNDGIEIGPFTIRHIYYIDLFFRRRMYRSRRTKSTLHASGCMYTSPTALESAWKVFVSKFNDGPAAFRKFLMRDKCEFYKHSLLGVKIEIHELCYNKKIRCAVSAEQKCPMCFSDTRNSMGHQQRHSLTGVLKDKVDHLDSWVASNDQPDDRLSPEWKRMNEWEWEANSLRRGMVELENDIRRRVLNLFEIKDTLRNIRENKPIFADGLKIYIPMFKKLK